MDNFEQLSSIPLDELNESDLQKVDGGISRIIVALYSIGIGIKLLEMVLN